jgi:hypothetical protein
VDVAGARYEIGPKVFSTESDSHTGAATILTYQLLKYQLSEIRRITEVYDDDQDSAEPSKQGSEGWWCGDSGHEMSLK